LSFSPGRPLINRALLGSLATHPGLGWPRVFTFMTAPDEGFRAMPLLCGMALRRGLSDVNPSGPGVVGYVRDVHFCSELSTDLKHTMISNIFTDNVKSQKMRLLYIHTCGGGSES
jgi:hypothetical protein